MNIARYNRNILINEIGKDGQKKLLESRVLIAGAGGLGSTVIANLAAVGIGNIGMVDNDFLEISNLNRQYIHKFNNIGKIKVDSAKDWVQNFNPDVNVEIYHTRLNEQNYEQIVKDYDFIIDCFDSYKSKFLLNRIAIESGKILVHGGVTEFYGQVTTIVPGKTACLACIIPDYDVNSYVVKGVISPAVTTIASIESLEAVKQILGIGETLENKLLTYNGLTMNFRKVILERNTNCALCGLQKVEFK